MEPRKALGKGLASLIPNKPEQAETTNSLEKSNFIEVDISLIIPNRLQPRKKFDEDSLAELAESILANGLIQPLVVTAPINGRYELIAGERRLRASKIANLTQVPVIIKEATPDVMLEFAILENIQREDLNPIDEARAYKELSAKFAYTQEDIANKMSKSRPYIANLLRLLTLPVVIQEDVLLGRLSAGHAKAMLSITDLQELLHIREQVLHSEMTVRDVENLVKNKKESKKVKQGTPKKEKELSTQLKKIIEDMKQELGTKIRLTANKKNEGGQIIIDYYSIQDLNRIYNKIFAADSA